MKIFKLLFIVIISSLFLQSCKCTGGPQLMPNVSGKAGEVVIVIPKYEWDGEIGSSLRTILAEYEPFLPQREPMFNLINIPEKAFTSIFQTHRNLIIVQIIPDLTEPKMVFQENVWAAPQIVATISAKNSQEAAQLISDNADRLSGAFLMAERNRNIQNAKRYEEASLRAIVTEEFGGSPYFPKGYSLKKRTENFIWISYETTYTNQGIFIYKFPYKDSTDLEKINLIRYRNWMLEKNVPGPVDRSYMTTNMQVDPGMRWVKFNRREFIEMKGLWEVQNDFMGGPFISHFFFDPTNSYVIAIEAFVYAPRFEKRNYLRQVESLIYSFEFF